MRLLVVLLAVVCSSLAVLGLPGGHHGGDRKINAELLRELETLLREELGELNDEETRGHDAPAVPHSASRTLSALARASPQTRRDMIARMVAEEKVRKELESISDGGEMMRRVVMLNLDTRADVHPTCATPTTCNTEDRIFIDGQEYRKANGTCNNLANPDYGSRSVQHVRLMEPVYPNDRWRQVTEGKAGKGLPSPRTVSNAIHQAADTMPTNTQGVTMALFQFLQFLDHDIIATPEGTMPPSRDCCVTTGGFCMPLFVPAEDPVKTEGTCMDARRSFTYLMNCDDPSTGMQNQVNEETAWIDASNVYGSSQAEQDALRSNVDGNLGSKLDVVTKTNDAGEDLDFLPEYTGDDAIPCTETGDNNYCFFAGDHRVNVIPTLANAHIMFVREHNRIAGILATNNADWDDEKVFQITRKIVAAQMQVIVYNEALPVVMGADQMTAWDVSNEYSYDSTVDGSIFSAFAIAFRFGHTLCPDTLDLPNESAAVNVEDVLTKSTSYLFQNNYNMSAQLQDYLDTTLVKEPDRTVADSLRDSLFATDTSDANDGFDLAALNIARSREWATPNFTSFKWLCGLGDTNAWCDLRDVTHTEEMIALLDDWFDDAEDVDLFTGIVTETKVDGSLLGKVGNCLIGKQFSNLKHGDRYHWTTSDTTVGFTEAQKVELEKTTYAKIACRNFNLDSIRVEAFNLDSDQIQCDAITTDDQIDLSAWTEGS